MKNVLTKNHLTIKKIFNKFLTQPRKALENMTGYQKLKRKYEILKTNNQIFKTALKKIAALNCPDNVFAKRTATEALLNETEQETN